MSNASLTNVADFRPLQVYKSMIKQKTGSLAELSVWTAIVIIMLLVVNNSNQ